MGNKEALFDRVSNVEHTAVTYDEITMRNEHVSQVDWRDVDVSGKISRNITAPNPILASPMTTVSGEAMGIAMAKEGGGAVIPHSYDIKEQRKIVRAIKLYLGGDIEEPITAQADDTVEETLSELERRRFDFRTLPVIGENGRFEGLVTSTHFELFRDEDKDVTVREAMTPRDEVFTAPSSTTVDQAYELMRQRKVKVLPLINENETVERLFVLKDVLRVMRGNPERYNLDENGRLRTFASVSTYEEDAVERAKQMQKYLDFIVIDTSHGEHRYSFNALEALKAVCKTVKTVREEFSSIDIMVGNVSEAATAAALAKEGPDAIRVGQGPGGICISRERLGGGCPQATAVYEISKAAGKIDPDIAICADGGIRGPGDITKARALGADSVMVGSLVSGTDETPGLTYTRPDGTKYKEYNGMGSAKEQGRSLAGRQRYGEKDQTEEVFVEGVEKEVDLKGPVTKVIQENTTGVKKQMSAAGFADVKTMQEEVSFWRVSVAGTNEGKASS